MTPILRAIFWLNEILARFWKEPAEINERQGFWADLGPLFYGHKLCGQRFLGSFGWTSISYDWSMVGKATISVTLNQLNDPKNRCAESFSLSHNPLLLVPISLLVSGVKIRLSSPACQLPPYFRPRDACYRKELFLANVGLSSQILEEHHVV